MAKNRAVIKPMRLAVGSERQVSWVVCGRDGHSSDAKAIFLLCNSYKTSAVAASSLKNHDQADLALIRESAV